MQNQGKIKPRQSKRSRSHTFTVYHIKSVLSTTQVQNPQKPLRKASDFSEKSRRCIDFSEEIAKEILLEDEIEIKVALNDGEYSSTAWGCDLTYDYVKINADYRS